MRLLIKLKALNYCSYDKKYYSKLRGFLYSLQKGSEVFNRHDLDGYKFFSYSNIFPAEDIRHAEIRHLIVSCPNSDFIYWMRGKFTEMQELQKLVEIGEMQFIVGGVKNFTPKIINNIKLITGTPIVIRIPKEQYKSYGIKSQRPYEYWRPAYDFNAFVKQLSENLIKKYNQYYNKKIKIQNLFEMFKFKKSVCVHRIEEGVEQKTIGSLWEFKFNHLEPEQKELLWLGLESGFGELNSSGFGFMNVVK